MTNTKISSLRSLRSQPENLTGPTARKLHLIYGLIRGRKIATMESPNSNPYTMPAIESLIKATMAWYPDLAEGQELGEYTKAKEAFEFAMRADLKAWMIQLSINWAQIQVQRAAKNRYQAMIRSNPKNHSACL